MKRRICGEDGFGLIELLISMVVLNIGILALVSAFNAGIVALNGAARASTASALADAQMEAYRGLTYGCIYLSAAGASTLWTGDTAFNQGTMVTSSQDTCLTPPPTKATSAVQQLVGPDHHKYEIDTYIVSYTPTSGRPGLKVSVAVHDRATGHLYVRQQSTFDISTGT